KSHCGLRAAYQGRARQILVVRAPGCAPANFWGYPISAHPPTVVAVGRDGRRRTSAATLFATPLTHGNGRPTENLKKLNRGIKLLSGVLQIVPRDNHNLPRRLRVGVEALVAQAAAHPKFA